MAKRMTYEKWVEAYKPVHHTRTKVKGDFTCIIFDGHYGEKQRPKFKHLNDDEKHVWSFIIDQDNGRGYIMPGFIRCDKFGIFLTEVPHEADAPVIALGKM